MMSLIRIACALALVLLAPIAQAQTKVPAEQPLEALVKSSLLSFNDANVTGIYTVFHAKTSKPFRDQFSPEKLKKLFEEFRRKDIDIDIIAALKPVYDPAPFVDSNGKLVVKGYFPTEPNRVNFHLDLIPSDGDWKLIEIDVKLAKP